MIASVKRLLACVGLVAVAIGGRPPAAGAASGEAPRAVTKRVTPEYPEVARKVHAAGKVKLSVVVTSEGKVKRVDVIGGHPLLVVAASDAASHPTNARPKRFDVMLHLLHVMGCGIAHGAGPRRVMIGDATQRVKPRTRACLPPPVTRQAGGARGAMTARARCRDAARAPSRRCGSAWRRESTRRARTPRRRRTRRDSRQPAQPRVRGRCGGQSTLMRRQGSRAPRARLRRPS